MARAESSLVIQRMPWHSTFTEHNHLGAALIAKPEVFGGVMTQLFSTQMYSDNALGQLLLGQEKTIGSFDWEWQLRGASTRPLVYVGTAAGSAQGTGQVAYDLPLDENWFVASDIIHPGNPKYQVRIQEAPFRRGNAWVYRVVPMTTTATPVTFLSPGAKWSKLYAQVEEGSEQSGSTQYALPLTLKSRLSSYRKKYMVTGDAANEVLAVKVPDSNGNTHNMWVKYAETEFWKQWYRELERGRWYSRSTDVVRGSTGRPIYSGPGVDELMEDAHQHYYTTFSANMVEEFLMDIFYSRVKPGARREIEAFTGEYGMIRFHRAVMDKFQSNGFITVDSNFIQSDKSEYHKNALSFGAQFTRYRMANGATLTLRHAPIFDDREIHYQIDPVTGYPYESQRFVFFDLSGDGMNSNMKQVRKRGGYKLAYVPGMQTPYGPQNNGIAAHEGDYYTFTCMDQLGIHIEDITKMGELRVYGS